MYENYNNQPEHKYEVVWKQYRKRHLPNGEGTWRDTPPGGWMTDGEFENAKVDLTVEQMQIKCGLV
jgi:hypothetical protein